MSSLRLASPLSPLHYTSATRNLTALIRSFSRDLRRYESSAKFRPRSNTSNLVEEIEVDGSMIFRDFKSVVATKFGVQVQYQRFWLFSTYHNYRISAPLNRFLTLEDEQLTMKSLANQFKFGDIKLFLEEMRGLDPLPPYAVLLFFKLYEPETKQLDRLCRYAGMMHVKEMDSLAGIESELKEMVGFPSHQQINFFKETDGAPTSRHNQLKKKVPIHFLQLHNGSILWFQKFPMLRLLLYRNPDVPSFLQFRYNLEFVEFRSRHDGGSLKVLLSKEHTYIQVACKLAKKIGLADPLKIWITADTAQSPIYFDPKRKLSDMLTPSTDRKSKKDENRILYFEERATCFTSVDLAKLEIEFHSASEWNKVRTHLIRLPFESDVHELVEKIIEQENLPNSVVDLLLFQVFRGQIREVFKACQMISSINFHQHFKLCAQELSVRERELRCGDYAIRVCHFKRVNGERRMEIENFGDPFLLVIGDDETLAGVKIRIKTKLLVSDEEFSKWMFAHIIFGEIQRYLEDADILLSQFMRKHGIEYLGLEHPTSSDEVNPAKSSKMVDPSSSSRKRKRKRHIYS